MVLHKQSLIVQKFYIKKYQIVNIQKEKEQVKIE